MHLREKNLRAVTRLWRELADIPAYCVLDAMSCYLDGVTRLIGAVDALWVAASRTAQPSDGDSWRGWQPREVVFLHPSTEREGRMADLLAYIGEHTLDPQTRGMIEGAGETRACLRKELLDDVEWDRSWLYQDFLRPMRIEDRLIGVHTISPHAESYIVVDRHRRDRPFSDDERDVLRLFLTGAPTFHREQFFARGYAESTVPLTPRQRSVLSLLLTDMSEPEIADHLGLTANTVHQYIVTILRKFGVRGRAGLMAKWLRYAPDEAATGGDLSASSRRER